MASSDPVEVAVEILDKFSDDLKKLEKQLDRIDGKKLSVTLDIDDGGDIEEVKALLEELERNLSTKLDIDVRGEKEALAIKKALAKNETATITYLTRGGDGPSGGVGGGKGGGSSPSGMPSKDAILASQTVNDLIDNHLKRLTLDGNPDWYDFTIDRQGRFFGPDGSALSMTTPETDFMRRIKKGTDVATGRTPGVPLGPMPARPGLTRPELDAQIGRNRRRNMIGNAVRNAPGVAYRSLRNFKMGAENVVPDNFSNVSTSFSKVYKALSKFKPTIMMWWQLIALLIPMLITLAGAILGVAAAFGAMAVAGAGIVGLGMLGYGDSMTESMENFKRRLKSVGGEIFGILRPVSAVFQPILDGWIGGVPGQVERLVDTLKRLSEFESALGRAGGGFVGWIDRGINAMADLSDMIGQVGLRFGGIIGDLIINLLVWATKEIYNNQEAFISLGQLLGGVISIIYNVSKAVSFAVAVFAPFFQLAAKIAGLLSNRWVVALLSIIAFLFIMQGAIVAVVSAYTALMAINFTMWALNAVGKIALVIGSLASWVAMANTA